MTTPLGIAPWEILKRVREEAKTILGEDSARIIEELIRAIIDDHEWKDMDD